MDLFKLNYVEIENKYGKYQKVYLAKQTPETIKTFKQVQVNSKKFINYFIINIADITTILEKLKKLHAPIPNFLINTKTGNGQIIYTLSKPLNLSSKKVTNYYNAIYKSILEHFGDKENTNLFMKNPLNKELFTIEQLSTKTYNLEDFKHLIIKNHILSFGKNEYNMSNNFVFNYLRTFCYRNILKISTKGKIIIENKGFEIARKLKEQGKLEDFPVEDLHVMVDKIFNYIQENRAVLIEKHGRRGRYNDLVKDCTNLKKKQQISAKTSAKINSEKKKAQVEEAINELKKSGEKITIKAICEKSGLSNKTVIKHYKEIKIQTREEL